MTTFLAIDFGGTRSRAALYDAELRLLRRDETQSRVHEGPRAVIDRLIALARSVAAGALPAAIGIAAPGPLDSEAGVIISAETLPGWSNVPIGPRISRAFANAPTFVQNDGNLGALAEYRFGAGRGEDPLLYLTISTGLGGGAIIGGELYTGASGLAIEPGHMRMTGRDGRIRRWEQLASGTALGELARERLAASGEPSLLRGRVPLDGAALGEAARAGDKLALDIAREAGEWLGLGLVNLLHLFNPRVIVLGGSATRLGDLILRPARRVIGEQVLHPGFAPADLLRLAEHGGDACLLGAALYCQSRLRAAAPD